MFSKRLWRATAVPCGTALLLITLVGPEAIFSAFQPQAMNFTVEGRITRWDRGKITINTEENVIFHIRYDEKTMIHRQHGGSASEKDLRVSAHVRIDGELSESGEIYAHTIQIE